MASLYVDKAGEAVPKISAIPRIIPPTTAPGMLPIPPNRVH